MKKIYTFASKIKKIVMTTMSITFDNPQLMPALEQLIRHLRGVTHITVSSTDTAAEIPNSATQTAIKELRTGQGFRCKNVEELFEQLSS
jgi:hypothetical protein